MATLGTPPARPPARHVAGIDLAGTEWPLYKIEAVIVGA